MLFRIIKILTVLTMLAVFIPGQKISFPILFWIIGYLGVGPGAIIYFLAGLAWAVGCIYVIVAALFGWDTWMHNLLNAFFLSAFLVVVLMIFASQRKYLGSWGDAWTLYIYGGLSIFAIAETVYRLLPKKDPPGKPDGSIISC